MGGDMVQIDDVYLGDGVYASYDGCAISLDLRAQDTTTRIVLEPEVFDALLAFRAAIADAQTGGREGGAT